MTDASSYPQISNLEERLEAVRDFQERKKEIESEMEALRDSKRETQDLMLKQKSELEKNFVEQTSRMKQDFEKKLVKQKRDAEENIDERLDVMVKNILSQNKQMSHELKLHIEV